MASIKDIELAIKAKDLASKPLTDIAVAASKLASRVDELAPAAEKGEGSLDGLKAVAGQLERALQGLLADQALIDRFKVLSDEFASASTKLATLKQNAEQAKLALASAADPTAALKSAANNSERAAASQEKAVRRIADALETVRGKASAAGLDLDNLATTERKLDSAFRTAAPAFERAHQALNAVATGARNVEATFATQAKSTRALSAAWLQLTVAARNARQAMSTGASDGTLQKMRGDVLALTGSFLGLFGAIQSVSGILDTVQKKNTVDNSFAVAFGPKSGEQFKFVEQQAERLGFRMLDLAADYGKFALASTSAGTSLEDTQTIFESFTEVSRALHLSSDQTQRVFLALEQVMSKGKISMEELRQQLGENLPGVMGVFAESLGVSQAHLNDLITKSGLSSKYLLNLAETYRDKFAGTIDAATKTPQAAIARFQTQLDKLKLSIAEGGFADSFTELLTRLTAFFKSPDGERFGKALATAMSTAASALTLVVEHARELGVVLAFAFGVKLIGGVVSFSTEIATLSRAAMPVAIATANVLRATLASLNAEFLGLIVASRAAAAGVTAGLAGIAGAGGYAFGTWLYNSSTTVQKWSLIVVAYVMELVHKIKALWLEYVPSWLGGGSKEEIEAAKRAIEADKATIADALKGGFDVSNAPGKPAATASNTDTNAARRAQANLQSLKQDEANATLGVEQELQSKIRALHAETVRQDATNVAEYRAALEEQFADLFAEIDAFGKQYDQAQATRLRSQLQQVIDLRVARAGDKFEIDKAKAAETEINELLRKRNALIESAKALKDQNGEQATNSKVQSLNNEFNDQIATKVKALQEYITGLSVQARDSLRETSASLEVMLVKMHDRPDVSKVEQVRKEEERINELVRLRNGLVEAEKAKRDAGLLTETEYRNAVADISNRYNNDIVPAASALLDVIATSVELTQAQRDALADVVTNLTIVRAKSVQVQGGLITTEQVLDKWANGLSNVSLKFIEAAVASGKLSGGFKAAGEAFKEFASSFLLEIAQMIIKQQILNALKSASNDGGWVGRAAGIIVSATQNHAGGMAGAGAPRQAMASWFNNAPRYHTGGVIGLSANEVPIIAKKGEEVLTESDPRNARNGGQVPIQLKVINAVDGTAAFKEAASTTAGQKAVMNIIRANKTAVKQLLT